jgi:hypothetical protein
MRLVYHESGAASRQKQAKSLLLISRLESRLVVPLNFTNKYRWWKSGQYTEGLVVVVRRREVLLHLACFGGGQQLALLV